MGDTVLTQESNLRPLAIDALACAFSLMARTLTSSYSQDAVMINRRIANLSDGSPEALALAFRSLNILARPAEYAHLRTVIDALAESLPCLWVNNFTSAEQTKARADLESLATAASELHAPDIVSKIYTLIDALPIGREARNRDHRPVVDIYQLEQERPQSPPQ